MASSLPAPPTALTPPVAWLHWDSDPGTDPAKKQTEDQKKAVFFLVEKEQFPEGAARLPALLVQARGEVRHALEVQGEAVLLPGQDYITPEPAVGHLSC